MNINPNPIAFSVGSVDVYWYGLLISSGVLIGVFLAMKEAARRGLDDELPLTFIFWTLPLSLIGTRLWYVAFNWGYYSEDLSRILAFREGGLAIHGGVITGLLVLIVFCRVKKLNVWQFGDIIAPSLILGQAIGRWGNFFNQEAYGVETTLPWAIYIAGVGHHPTFLYESLWNLLVFAALIYMSRKDHIPGEIMIKYFIYYSAGRYFIEGLRTDSLFIGPFRTAQLVSLILIHGGLLLLWWRRRQFKNASGKRLKA